MRYKLQCINDNSPTETIELDSIEVIPPWGDLIVTISEDILDNDLERIRADLKRFFGEQRKIGIVRAGEITFTLVPHSGISTEGAAWAMEGGGVKPYIYVTNQNGVAFTVFTHYIVLIEPSVRNGGTYIQLNMGGVEVRENYEDVMKQVSGGAPLSEQEHLALLHKLGVFS